MDELRHAHIVLGLDGPATREQVTRAYRRAAKGKHPDAGGDAADFVELQRAHRMALAAAPSMAHRGYATVVADTAPPAADRPTRRPAPQPAPRAEAFADVFARQLRRHGIGLA
ncbi:MAG: hypothetical protein P8N02_06660 [Actinomycetota bacterium]|nr:hypothetical protein [Actinomycetota bacterium]